MKNHLGSRFFPWVMLPLVISALLLTGCARMHPAETVTMAASPINPPLDRAADKVADAWHLPAVKNAAVHPPLGGSPALPPALSRTVPIAWTGPIAPTGSQTLRLCRVSSAYTGENTTGGYHRPSLGIPYPVR